ncbi:FecR family protein [Gaoshiqia sp. Z1-71]|uniref:FecR family protein n=1 Tax=Gaoshiqia hydrogeniformans TaxID=3290090 RepID=UPI003BF786EA
MEKKDIEALLIKSFTGQTDKNEEQTIGEWLAGPEENRKTFEAYRKLWENSKTLTLSGAFDVEPALRRTKQQIPQFTKKTRLLSYWRQAAAVFVLSVLLSSAYHFLMKPGQNTTEQTVYQEIKAAYGTQTKLVLADGTAVWLNAGSTLRFPLSFNHLENRRVDLKGEGYFEVAKDEKQPFIVHTSKLQVKVLGTSFNLNAYEEEEHVEVALIEGKVELLQQVKGKDISVMRLNPSDVADYDTKNNQIVRKAEPEITRYTAWKDGKIVFFDDPVEKLVSRLENWYNVDIEIADRRLMAYHFTATFSHESLDQVLKYLSISTPMNYEFIMPLKTDKGEEQRTKVILFGR